MSETEDTYNFIDSKVVLKEDRIIFKTEKFHYLRFWAANRKPNYLVFEDIERCYIDDSGASHGFESTRPHVIIEHSKGRIKLAFVGDELVKIQPVIEREKAEELVEKIKQLSEKDIAGKKQKKKDTSGKQNQEESDSNSKAFNTVKEYKRTCNECGKTWHSLAGREKELKRSEFLDNCQEGLNACSCNYQASAQHRKNRQDTNSELERLRQCPECGSRNYDEEVIEYEDK